MEPNVDLLLAKMNDYSGADQALIRKAYIFAQSKHAGQMRISGVPYFVHPFGVAMIVADMHMPATIIAAALLHDILEDTPLPQKQVEHELRETFDNDITTIVERVTKLSRVRYQGMTRYLENLRKMFIAMAEDLRVVVLKFADRLNNLQDLDVLPENKRLRVATETLELYAPIANRLGMGDIKGRLEDAAFRHAYPEEYTWVKNLVKDKLEEKELHLLGVQQIVSEMLASAGIPTLSINGRAKRLFSLYKKLLKRNRDLSKVYDFVAVRIITKNVTDCYAVLGAIHGRFKPLKGRIKDYIAQPKPNGYQSLHTTVFADDGEIVEFQIRTQEMHDEAEYGVAAHWRYDEHGKKVIMNNRQTQWMQDLVQIQKAVHDRKILLETLEELKLDVFKNRIFVFSPKGDVLDLPEDSTPVDFAYAIHTDLGDHCSQARVNGEMAPLDTTINSGDIIEIITDRKRRGPSAEWLKSVKTHHARQKIKAHHRGHLTAWMRDLFPRQKQKHSR